MANASFDPYLQGPQGGIWFWSAVGLGMAAMRAAGEPHEHDPPVVEQKQARAT